MMKNRNLLVGGAAGDDAGVYRIGRDRALVETVDFFTPIVDDPFAYGQIAAANALSDVYAMGGRPLTALNLVGIPTDIVPLHIVNRILRGGAAKMKEAKCMLVGGHTIRNPEPIYGFAVTGLVSPRHLLTNANARPGDLLVLTKPLGTGIITTAAKRGLANRSLERRAIGVMTRLNTDGPELAKRGLARAAVDDVGGNGAAQTERPEGAIANRATHGLLSLPSGDRAMLIMSCSFNCAENPSCRAT